MRNRGARVRRDHQQGAGHELRSAAKLRQRQSNLGGDMQCQWSMPGAPGYCLPQWLQHGRHRLFDLWRGSRAVRGYLLRGGSDVLLERVCDAGNHRQLRLVRAGLLDRRRLRERHLLRRRAVQLQWRVLQLAERRHSLRNVHDGMPHRRSLQRGAVRVSSGDARRHGIVVGSLVWDPGPGSGVCRSDGLRLRPPQGRLLRNCKPERDLGMGRRHRRLDAAHAQRAASAAIGAGDGLRLRAQGRRLLRRRIGVG